MAVKKKAAAKKSGMVHTLPADLSKVIKSDGQALATWQDITPLARNEYICWVTSAKQDETRKKRVIWAKDILKAGKRRPCCWPGCPHR
jgi:uncharacterized protein YdeI (YjbR/CyaY-like superfamily)